jgi:hypothetical protein
MTTAKKLGFDKVIAFFFAGGKMSLMANEQSAAGKCAFTVLALRRKRIHGQVRILSRFAADSRV